MTKNQIAGNLFEIFILKLVLMSGYKTIDFDDIDQKKYRIVRKRFVEFKGRGEFHQIDIPVDLEYRPNFIYPIRLLGEVKHYSRPITKNDVRHEIGKMKDIQENYFVDDELTNKMRARRRTEVFAIFSASGFNEAAERLAYAHGIKTVSYKDNKHIHEILDYVNDVATDISSFPEEEQTKIIDEYFNILIMGHNLSEDVWRFPMLLDFYLNADHLLNIRTSIIGTTSTGLTIHFLSNDIFPEYLFENTDFVYCRVRSTDSLEGWYLEIGESETKFYFSLPEIIKSEYFDKGDARFYPRKGIELDSISFYRTINGKIRLLEFRFDHDWFSEILQVLER